MLSAVARMLEKSIIVTVKLSTTSSQPATLQKYLHCLDFSVPESHDKAELPNAEGEMLQVNLGELHAVIAHLGTGNSGITVN